MMDRRRDARDAGFTLLELVVCLGLLAVIATMTAEGIALVRHGALVLDRAEAAETDLAVRAYIARAGSGIVRAFAGGADGMPRLAFSGQPEQLRFLARADARLEGEGLVVVQIGTADRESGRALVTTRRILLLAGGETSDASTFTLLEGVESFRLRYFGHRQHEAQAGWHSEWENADSLPELVEVSVRFESTARTALWPPLVVRLPGS